jgi:hypothetical protein
MKALLRAMVLRSVDELWKALGTITGCVSSRECKNFVGHAGLHLRPCEQSEKHG